MTKCLFRFTVGPVNNLGIEILHKSIKNFKRIYPNCDLAICHNNVNKDLLPKNVKKYNQKEFTNSLKHLPLGASWKFYPPRLSLDQHEIIIDNDVVFDDKIPSIDKFLSSKTSTLLYEGRHHALGAYSKFLPNTKINSGIYGVPPKFDLQKKLNNILLHAWSKNLKGFAETHDDQGAIAMALLNEDTIIISQKEVPILEPHESLKHGLGYHFVHANQSNQHKGWSDYLSQYQM